MMAPIFPHISEELWHRRAQRAPGDSIHLQRWPVGDPEKAKDDAITVVVQVNGKVRDKLTVAPGTAKETLESQALALQNVQKWNQRQGCAQGNRHSGQAGKRRYRIAS